KYFCANEIASSSLLTKTSPQPETEQCILAPPISSKETFSPITFSAIRGEPKYMEALPSTITTISQNAGIRSEEHTSELQSRFDLVCRLLLEKKKTTIR